MMTGGVVPADVAEGDQVTGGTIALTGRLVVRADRVGPDTQLAQLIRLVEQAQADKAAVQRLADRICGVFVPAVLVLAAATLAGWLLAGRPAAPAFSAGLAVLIIACPCALGLATPAALVVACGRGAQLGIFIKGYQALESSRSIDTVVLDKTGTVTTGRMTVTGVHAGRRDQPRRAAPLAGAVEQASEHAVAAAITAARRPSAGRAAALADGFRALPGLGARGIVDGARCIVGRERLLREHGLTVPAELSRAARRLGAGRPHGRPGRLGRRGPGRSRWPTRSSPRPAARSPSCARLGLRPVLLTGDNEATARAVAAAAGSTRSSPRCCPPRRPTSSPGCTPTATGWPWSATASTTGPPWPPPPRAGHRVGHRRRHQRGRPDPAPRRPGDRARRDPARPGHLHARSAATSAGRSATTSPRSRWPRRAAQPADRGR